jgi:hypothetical protein
MKLTGVDSPGVCCLASTRFWIPFKLLLRSCVVVAAAMTPPRILGKQRIASFCSLLVRTSSHVSTYSGKFPLQQRARAFGGVPGKRRQRDHFAPRFHSMLSSLSSTFDYDERREESFGGTTSSFYDDDEKDFAGQTSSTSPNLNSAKTRPSFSSPRHSPDDSGTASVSSSSLSSWYELGLQAELVVAVTSELGFAKPTLVQQLVVPELLQASKDSSATAQQQSLAFLAATVSVPHSTEPTTSCSCAKY